MQGRVRIALVELPAELRLRTSRSIAFVDCTARICSPFALGFLSFPVQSVEIHLVIEIIHLGNASDTT